MAGTDGVDVMLLHQAHIALNVRTVDGGTDVGVGVVAVRAAEDNAHAVDQHDAVLDLDGAHTDAADDGLAGGLDLHGVQGGGFSRPQLGIFNLEGSLAAFDGSLAQLAAAGCVQGGGGGDGFAAVVNLDGHVAEHVAFAHDVAQVLLRAGDHVHVTEDTVVAELVLILQIGGVAPLEDGDGQHVLADDDLVGHVKLGGGVGNLRHADELAVDPRIEAGIHAVKVQVAALALFLPLKGTTVHAAGILARDVGRIEGEGIVDVGILRVIKAVVLPHGRHGHLHRIGQGIAADGLRHVLHRREPAEVPRTVEGNGRGGIFRQVPRTGRLCADADHLRLLVVIGQHGDFLLALFCIFPKQAGEASIFIFYLYFVNQSRIPFSLGSCMAGARRYSD